MDFEFELFMNEENEHSLLKKRSDVEADLEKKEQIYGMKDAVIFLIDCQALKFINENIELTNSEILKQAYLEVMKRKVVFYSSDKVGLILYNSGNKNNFMNFEGIYIFDDLESVNAQRIKQSQNLNQKLDQISINSSGESKLREVIITRLYGFVFKDFNKQSTQKYLIEEYSYLQLKIPLKLKLKKKKDSKNI